MKHRFLIVSVLFTISFTSYVNAQDDIALNDVVALALKRNYDIQLARNNSLATTTNNGYAWAAFAPQLSATGSALWNSNDQSIKFQDATKNASGTNESNNIAGSVLLNWTLFDGTKMFATRNRIAILAEQGELLVKDQMINTISSVITNYYNVVRQKQQLKAIQEQMAVSEERVKLAEKKLQVGTGGKPELLQARVDLNAQRTQVLQQEATIAQLKEQLNALVGQQLPEVYDVGDTIIINANLRADDILQNVENSNYSLQAAHRNFDIADLALHERIGELFPTISFTGQYNYSKNENTRLINPFSTIFSQTNGYNYGFTIAVPILNGFNTGRQIQLAKITSIRQRTLYDQLKTNVNVSIRNAYVNYDNALKVLTIEEETILLAKENVFIALESFKRSVATYIELRTAQQSLADAYNRLIAARYNAKVAETELLRLNGGLLLQE